MSRRSMQRYASFETLSFVLPFIFYTGFALFDGPVWCVDSPSYTSMDFSREPVYPLFLLLFRKIFELFDWSGKMYGLDSYLFPVILVQTMLWVHVTARLGKEIYEEAGRFLPEKKALFLGYTAIATQLAVSALNRLMANRGSMYSECIMTEALAMPILVMFVIYLWKLLRNFSNANLIKTFLLAILAASIRKQMLILLIVWGGTALVVYLMQVKNNGLHKLFTTILMIFAAYVCISGSDRIYNYCVRGEFAEHIGNSKGGLDTVLYTASAEDKDLFTKYDESEDYPNLSGLYEEIYNTLQEKELTIDFAPGYEKKEESTIFNSDWAAMASHYADSYDVIGFDIVQVKCDEYVAENFPELEGTKAQLKENAVEGVLFKTLLKKDISDVFHKKGGAVKYVFTANVLKAFVISAANMRPAALIKASFLIYFFYLAIFIMLALKAAQGAGTNVTNGRRTFLLLSFITFAAVAVNCVVTGSMIFPQPRYMCYTMGLFYLTLTCGILC
ncbi:hypothetical protein D6856_09760 [Butyrivibrio sp. XB500-5]|uniref:hypothetical protein n=1 Tax=Butyrivibrio sp. XB500-5 TaxID=2364880 RepID=UPI000EAA1F7C|nr:hypothetical protein [Butyrivibrio sp. XB500-5]RKM59495.1 hypothetical protein D6856_09760 [Butyrivibrio sp. XB500-5]